MSLSRYQLERADLLTTIEQGRRVEIDLFQENSRGIRSMGELLKARMFGATEYAISLRKRMTNFQGGVNRTPAPQAGDRPPEPHQWPCEDPWCDPCDAATKRLLRDLNILPKGKPDRASYTADPITGRLKVPSRYRKDESDK